MNVDIVIAVAERGGPENIIKLMIKKMKPFGIRFRVVQMAWEGYRWLDAKVPFYPLTEGKGGHSPAEFVQKYSELLEQTGQVPDLVLAVAWPYMSLIAKQVLVGKGLDVPVVSWLHSGIQAYASKGFGAMRELMAADAHFAINGNLWEDIRKVSGSSVVYRINNPVEMAGETTETDVFAKKELQRTILFVGRISAEKNVKFILDAMTHLPDWTLIIIGDGEERASMEAHCKYLNLGQRVQWLGWQQNPWKYADKADAMVMASYYEGFPLTVIEAQSRGLPVISTRVDGITEFIEHGRNGYLYDFGDMETYCNIFSMIQAQGYVVEHPEEGRKLVREYDSELVFWDMAVKMQAIRRGVRLRPNTSNHPYYVFRQELSLDEWENQKKRKEAIAVSYTKMWLGCQKPLRG